MAVPVTITLRDIPHSDAVETRIRQKVEKLGQFYDNIIGCDVVVEYSQNAKHQGKLHNVRINISVPGKELVANHKEAEDIYVALRDAFAGARRQLEEFSRQVQGDVKTHSLEILGKVVRKFDQNGNAYGFIESMDGEEYYFNADNVVGNKFDKIKIGNYVHFVEAVGDEGLQAHHVSVDRKRSE